MTQTVTLRQLQAMLAQATDEVFVVLLTFDHADLNGFPIRLCNDSRDLTSHGLLYRSFPFYGRLAQDAEDQEPRAQIEISNVSLEIMEKLRQLRGRPKITLAVVTVSEPNAYIRNPTTFETPAFQADKMAITFECIVSELAQEPFPYLTMSPAVAPAIFA